MFHFGCFSKSAVMNMGDSGKITFTAKSPLAQHLLLVSPSRCNMHWILLSYCTGAPPSLILPFWISTSLIMTADNRCSIYSHDPLASWGDIFICFFSFHFVVVVQSDCKKVEPRQVAAACDISNVCLCSH